MHNILVTGSNGQLGNELRLVVGENDIVRQGTPTYAHDLANVIYAIIQNNDNTNIKNQIYHYSNEGVCSWYDFAVAINEASGNSSNIKPCHSDEFPGKVTRPNYSVLDKTKIKKALDIKIPYWRVSMLDCIKTFD